MSILREFLPRCLVLGCYSLYRNPAALRCWVLDFWDWRLSDGEGGQPNGLEPSFNCL